jgi:hypothetical protein
MAFIVFTTSCFVALPAAKATNDPIIFADGTMIFTDKAGFNEAAKDVCHDIDKVWFDSTKGVIGPANQIFAEGDDGNGVMFTSTSILTGTNGHSEAEGPFTDVTLTATDSDCGFKILSFDMSRGDDSLGKNITLTLSNGDTVTEAMGHPTDVFFGVIDTNTFTSAQINSDASMKNIQETEICGDACSDTPTPEPGAATTIGLGGLALLGLLALARGKQRGPAEIA